MIKINKNDFAPTVYPSETGVFDPSISRTTSPITIGSSIIGIKYDKGIIIGADTLISYGRLEHNKNVKRISKITDYAAFASSGEYSDYQEAQLLFEQMQQTVKTSDDNIKYTPKDFANYLARNCYAKRNKMDPLYISSIVGGHYGGKSYLGMVDLFGTIIEDNWLVTGFANYLCKPIISNEWRADLSKEEAKKIMEECFKVLFYRDCGAHDKVQFCFIEEGGITIDEPVRLETTWSYRLTRERANEKIYLQ